MTNEIIVLVDEQIRFDLSPEQVSGYLKEQYGIHGYTSISGQIGVLVVIYIPTCVNTLKNAVRNTAQKISVGGYGD